MIKQGMVMDIYTKWTIAAAAAPVTGGGSLAVAAVLP